MQQHQVTKEHHRLVRIIRPVNTFQLAGLFHVVEIQLRLPLNNARGKDAEAALS